MNPTPVQPLSAPTPAVHRTFVLQRLHSLCGVLPLGAYLVFHLLVHAPMAFGGPESWSRLSAPLRSPIVALLTLVLLGVPLGFHAVYGLVLLRRRGGNLGRYPTAANLVFSLQSLSGVILLIFLALHIWQLRVIPLLHRLPLDARAAHRALQSNLVLDVYILGVGCAVFHLWAGVWTLLVRFGFTPSRRSQRTSAVVCGVLGLVMLALGVHVAAAFHDPRYAVL